MDFYEVVRQAVKLLQEQGRLTYRTLKRQFDLDDEALEDLKDELLFSHPVVDEAGRGLVWTGDPAAPERDVQRVTEAEVRFQTALSAVIGLLQRDRRVTYRTLKWTFGVDDALLEEICEELALRQLAVDENGKVLVWTGGPLAAVQPAVPTSSQHSVTDTTAIVSSPAASTLAPPVTETSISSDGPTTPAESLATEALQDESAVTPAPVRSAPEAERRQLTVMFCDLVDSTKLSGQLDPEDYREVVRAYQATCAEVIHRFDGYIAQHLGDAFLVYFGFPQAHEDDAQRAIRAGLGMLEAMKALNTRLEQAKGIRLAIRVGIHTGLTVVGDVSSGPKRELLAMGEAPNVASRIQGIAEPDTIAISEATYRLIEGYFTVANLGHHTLKGVAAPMQVYRVLGESEAQSRLEVAAIRGHTPLVGRELEVTLLFERWHQVKDGQGQVVLLSGEGGIGKSRLVQVLKEHVADEPHTRWECRSSPYYQNTALYPITDLFQRTLQWQQDATLDEKLEKLEQTLSQYRLPLEESVPPLAPLLSLSLPEDRYPPLQWSPQRQRQKTLEAIVSILLEQAEQQPVLFILEDLHWTDPTTLEFVDLLIDQVPMASLLALLTCRPTFQPTWGLRTHLTPIALNRLSRNQIETMAEQVAGGKTLPSEVRQRIVERTDGVLLFVEEMTKALLESGVLKETNGHYELLGAITSLSIPATLQGSLMARLDRLGSAKGIAQIGATIGRQFAYALLCAVSQIDAATV